MRTIISIIALFLTLGTSYAAHSELVQIRSAFVAATQDMSAREDLVQAVSQAEIEEVYRLAYLGASKTLLAECGYSPWTKWSHFKEGKELIEQAIARSPKNAEFRYLRFLIQFNAPTFLGYGDQLVEDYRFVQAYLNATESEEVWTSYFRSFCAKHAEEITKRIQANS
jgi:hypothetical protein